MAKALLGLGSNVGNPLKQLTEAVYRIGEISLLHQVSSLYRTEPVGFADQDWFLNCAAVVETSLTAHELLDRLLRIEAAMGRVRDIRNGPRAIDIDILLCDDRRVDGPPLTIPHPRMHQRAFVLQPAAEIAPDWRHPVLQASIKELAQELAAAEGIERISEPAWPPRAAP